MLYPQSGDRIVTIDSATSRHPKYTAEYDTVRVRTASWSEYTVLRVAKEAGGWIRFALTSLPSPADVEVRRSLGSLRADATVPAVYAITTTTVRVTGHG